MEFELSERLSYGTGYHVVASYAQYKLLSPAELKAFFSIADHYLVALHTHGFRDHVHIQMWTKTAGVYSNIKRIWPDAHLTKINKSYFETKAEVSCTQGYARVKDYILRDSLTLYHEQGDFAKVLLYEYLGELNKYTRVLEKAAVKDVESSKDLKDELPAANYRYLQALAQLGGRKDDQLNKADDPYLDLDEESLDRDNN